MLLSKTIKVKAALTIEEILEKLRNENSLPGVPYLYQGLIGGSVLYVPGKGENDIQISVEKGKMIICDTPRPTGVGEFAKSTAIEIILRIVTNGWSIFFPKPSNKDLFAQVVGECERLFTE